MANIDDEIKAACEALRAGGIILYPTDTVWGIGCDATNEEAVRRVFALKQREDAKAMLVLVDDAAKLNTYVREVPDIAWELVEAADKPLTVIYPQGKNLAPALLAEDGSVGIRITREEFSHKLCWRYRKPIVSTSANISGQTAPASFGEISEEIKQGVDYIVRYGRKEKSSRRPSSIIKLETGNTFQIIRR